MTPSRYLFFRFRSFARARLTAARTFLFLWDLPHAAARFSTSLRERA